MPLSTTQKKKVIKEFQTGEGDTGSPEVQIALLTTRVDKLTEHLKHHIHDAHSRRGLLSMIAKRRRLLNFLTKVDKTRSAVIEGKIGFEKPHSVPLSGTPKGQAEKVKRVKKATKKK